MNEVRHLESREIFGLKLQYRCHEGLLKLSLLDNDDNPVLAKKDCIEIYPHTVHYSEDGYHWSITDHQGKNLFNQSFEFSLSPMLMGDDRYVLQKENSFGLTDLEGQDLLPCRFDSVLDWDAHSISMISEGKACAFDRQGREILPPKYDSIHILGEGLFEVIRRDKRALYHQEIGFITPYDDFEFTPFHEGIAGYHLGNREWGLIDATGRRVTVPELEELEYLDEGVFVFCFEEGRWGVIDDRQKILFPPRYSWVSSLGSGFLTLSKDSRVSLVNLQGEQILPFRFTHIQSLDGRSFLCRDSNGFRFYDNEGDAMFFETFPYAAPFQNGVAPILWKNNSFLLSERGEILFAGERRLAEMPLWR